MVEVNRIGFWGSIDLSLCFDGIRGVIGSHRLKSQLLLSEAKRYYPKELLMARRINTQAGVQSKGLTVAARFSVVARPQANPILDRPSRVRRIRASKWLSR